MSTRLGTYTTLNIHWNFYTLIDFPHTWNGEVHKWIFRSDSVQVHSVFILFFPRLPVPALSEDPRSWIWASSGLVTTTQCLFLTFHGHSSSLGRECSWENGFSCTNENVLVSCYCCVLVQCLPWERINLVTFSMPSVLIQGLSIYQSQNCPLVSGELSSPHFISLFWSYSILNYRRGRPDPSLPSSQSVVVRSKWDQRRQINDIINKNRHLYIAYYIPGTYPSIATTPLGSCYYYPQFPDEEFQA